MLCDVPGIISIFYFNKACGLPTCFHNPEFVGEWLPTVPE
jgi:hypothetical protein